MLAGSSQLGPKSIDFLSGEVDEWFAVVAPPEAEDVEGGNVLFVCGGATPEDAINRYMEKWIKKYQSPPSWWKPNMDVFILRLAEMQAVSNNTLMNAPCASMKLHGEEVEDKDV